MAQETNPSKECFKCGGVKPLTEFYRHPQMADGHLGKCKECSKRDVRENRAKNVDYYRAYDAERFRKDPKVSERNRRYQATPQGRASAQKARKAWMDANQDKRAAHIILGNAVRDKRIEKPTACQLCGVEGKRIDGHHEDYTKPLDVIWCCRKCHIATHKHSDTVT